jgi:hypothetical protein
MSDSGMSFVPTALRIWELLLSEAPQIRGYTRGSNAQALWDRAAKALEEIATDQYEMLLNAHMQSLAQEKNRSDTSFSARRKAIERIGLAEVRNYRLKHLEEEKKQWEMEFERAQEVIPEMNLLLIANIQKEGL